MDARKENELGHEKFLAPNAHEIWGWGTPDGVVRAKRRAELLIEHGAIQSGSRVRN